MQEDQIKKLITDKEWRMSHLYKIVDTNKQQVVFKPNKAQKHFNDHKASRNIILKSRQLGFTTFEAIDMLDDVLFNKNFEGLFIAHTKDDATDIFNKKIDYAWKHFDKELKPMWRIEKDSAMKLKFDLGGDLFSSITVANSGRSGTYNRVHISEYAKLCALFPKRDVLAGTIPTLHTGSRFDIESTAEGMGGNFSDMFWDSWTNPVIKHESQIKAHFYNWTWDEKELNKIEHPFPTHEMDNSIVFRKLQEQYKFSDIEITYYYTKWIALKKDWDMLHQEYPITPEEAFVFSGSNYFDQERIKKYIALSERPKYIGEIERVNNEIKLVMKEDGHLMVWKEPEPYSSYTIGGDTAEGLQGGDYQVLVVLNNKTLKVDAKYKSHIPPDELAKVANSLGLWYNKAYLGIEANKDGLWVNTELFKLGYPNLYFREEFDSIANKVSPRIGFKTTMQTRDVILTELKNMINNYEDIWTNRDFLYECMTFIRNKVGKPEAMHKKHDDEIIATAIAYFIRKNVPVEFEKPVDQAQTSLEYVKARLEKIHGNKSNQDFQHIFN